MPRLILTLELNKKIAEEVSTSSFSTATDFADYLAIKGIPFREAHSIVGKIVKHCEKTAQGMSEIPINQLKKFSKAIDKDVYKLLDAKNSIKTRSGVGETSPKSVKRQAQKNLKRLRGFGYKR